MLQYEYLVRSVINVDGSVALEWASIGGHVFIMDSEIGQAVGFGATVRGLSFLVNGNCYVESGDEIGRYLYIAQKFGNRLFILP